MIKIRIGSFIKSYKDLKILEDIIGAAKIELTHDMFGNPRAWWIRIKEKGFLFPLNGTIKITHDGLTFSK